MNRSRNAVVVGLCLLTVLRVGATPDTLRVLSIRPDAHDYVLMSAMGSDPDHRVYTVNDRQGRTHFVQVGERLGEFLVVRGTVLPRTVFDPTLRAERQEKEIRLVLRDTAETEIELTPGTRVPHPGFRAVLVEMTTGRTWDVRPGDAIEAATFSGDVLDVQQAGVTVREGSAAYPVALVSEYERAGLETLWARQRAEREARLQAVELARQEEDREAAEQQAEYRRRLALRQAVRKPPRIEVTLQAAPSFCFGTEYRYPVEWRVLPLTSAGGQRPQVLVMPRRFTSRMVTEGVSIRMH